MTKDEALKMAIEALERYGDTYGGTNGDFEALKACEEALEQPAQEPVAFDCKNCHACLKGVKGETGYPITMTRMIVCPDCGNKRCPKATDHRHFCTNSNDTNQAGSIYNAHPAPSWQGLSDEEIFVIIHNNLETWNTFEKISKFIDAIEQALKEKNHGTPN